MVDKVKRPSVFERGSTWLRSDFHLHTKADKEFSYSDDDSYYLSNYIEELNNADIRVGLISNHNKFDVEEFKALRKSNMKYIKKTKDDLRNHYFDFPFGKVDALQVVLFMSGHTIRHTDQIKEVMRSPGFPAS